MRVGLIVESTPQGMEAVVCPRILEILAAECNEKIEREPPVTMTNKKLLILGAADATKSLLQSGCQRVVILWDENPPWKPDKAFADKRCWHFERDEILKSLNAAAVDLARVGLVCIEREFETWLLHDTDLLRSIVYVSEAHKPKVSKIKNPVKVDDPKARLMKLCRDNKAPYNADVAARRVRANLNSLDRLKNCDTFRYFVFNALGRMPAGWQPYVYHRKGPKK